jgi:hypothetical protein
VQQVLAVQVDHGAGDVVGEEQHALQGWQASGAVDHKLVVQRCAQRSLQAATHV